MAGPEGRRVGDGPAAPPMPFIVGCARSGTTLLRSMLDSHPDLAIPGENHFLRQQFRRRTPFAAGHAVPHNEIVAALAEAPRGASFLGDLPSIGDGTDAGHSDALTMAEWIRETYGTYAAARGKTRFGDKSPLIDDMAALADLVPEAVFIHLIRDGRDVALALLDQQWGPTSVRAAATMWRDEVTRCRALGLQLPRRRYLELRYEDLVADPEARLVEVCELIDLPYDPAMCDYQRSAREAQAMTPFPESHARLDGTVRRGLRDWTTQMSTIDQARFDVLAGPLLESCGYRRTVPTTTIRRAQVGARWLRYRARAVARRIR